MSESMWPKLKPCPKCGGELEYYAKNMVGCASSDCDFTKEFDNHLATNPQEELAQLRAMNARLLAQVEQIRRYADNEEVEMVCKEALSSDASQDLAAIREAIEALKPMAQIYDQFHDDSDRTAKRSHKALAALRERFGSGE